MIRNYSKHMIDGFSGDEYDSLHIYWNAFNTPRLCREVLQRMFFAKLERNFVKLLIKPCAMNIVQRVLVKR